MNVKFGLSYAWMLCALLMVSQLAVAQESSWDSLPEETVAALRVPNGKALAEALKETKFGTVMFSEQRKQAVIKALESDGSEEWAEFQEQLKEYGLTVSDLIGLLAGESGYAVVMQSEEGAEPFFAGLGWLQPGDELAGRVRDVIAKLIDEQDDDEHAVARVDIELADIPIMQLQVPDVEVEYTEELDFDFDDENMSEEERDAEWDRRYEEWEKSAVETVVYNTVLIGRLDDRLLIAHTYAAQNEEKSAANAERLQGILSRWINAHRDGSGEFVSRMSGHATVARTMGQDGLSVFEILGDAAPLISQLEKMEDDEEMSAKIIRIMGLRGIGPFAIRSTVGGTRWRTNYSIAVPAPRQGLMRLLDQEQLEVDPPHWVPASTVRYNQWSFDLGKAYEIIKVEVQREFPDQAAAAFAMAEGQMQGFAQASVSDVLGSLGNRHTVLSFGFDSAEGEDAADVTERTAIVWQLDDEDLWARLLKAIGPFAGSAPGVESAEEQGFSGWRMKNEQLEGGLFLGKGYLVFGYGAGVVESVLSSINNPPEGSNAFRGSEVFAQAGQQLDLQPAMFAEVTDGERYMKMLFSALNTQFSQMADMMEEYGDEVDASGTNKMIAVVKALTPTDDELENIMGVIASRLEINDDGIFAETVQEVPGK